jgi:membrane-associated protease RseP (regulator of RpoE activity)
MEKLSDRLSIFAAIFTTLSLGTSPHPFILVLCYIIHEVGHITLAKIAGAKIKKLKIGSFHLSLSYDCSELSYKREILVQLGGIIFNLTSAGILSLFSDFGGGSVDFFIICSLCLAVMNLYPASVLDGGGVLKSILLLKMDEDRAVRIFKSVSLVCIILMWMLSVYLQIIFCANLSLFVISVVLLVELCFESA